MVTECCSEASVDAARTVVIGDAIYDMQMAKAAGAKAIGVSWGYASVPELVAAGADHILRTPADLLDWLETF
jgi:phosphoglycolate phosphatase